MARVSQRKKRRFLEALRQVPCVTLAAEAADVPRQTLYAARQEDPEFAAAWEEAREQGYDVAEAEAWRRAVDGVKEPVYQGGELVGHRLVYSDALLDRLLKAHKPQRYDPAQRHEVTGANGGPLVITWAHEEADERAGDE